jgi:lipopolysaccharide export system protein LptC
VTLSRRELLIALLLLAAGLLAWWYRGARQPEDVLDAPRQGQPDYVVEQVAAVMMSESGEPLRRLWSPELRAYPGDGGNELDAPLLHLLEPGAPDWVIRSEAAWISAEGDEVLLEGRVLAERDAVGSEPALRVRTSELLLLEDYDYAETDRFVELERGSDWLTAVDGMRLWFEAPMRSRFFGRVRQQMHLAENENETGERPDPASDQPQ